MKILCAYGIPDAIVNHIDRMYTDTMAKVITADGLTEIFKILAGVTLAPYLFIIIINYIMSLVTDNATHGFTTTPAFSKD